MKVDIRIVITVGALIGGIIFGYSKFQEKVATTESTVEKHDVRLDKIDVLDMEQSTLIQTSTSTVERNTRLLEKLEARF